MTLPPKLRRIAPVALPLLVLLGGAAAFAGLSSLQPARPEPTVQERVAATVRVVPLEPRSVTLDVVGHGSARARDNLQLGTEVAGRVAFVASSLRVGSFVAAGEELVRLDDREHRIARRSAQADVGRAQAELDRLVASEAHLDREVQLRLQRAELAEAELSRQLELESSGIAARDRIEQARSNLAQEQFSLRLSERALDLLPHDVARARAILDASRAALDQADYALERLVLRAPIPAQVRGRDVEIGQVVAAGTPLIALSGHEVYEVPVQLSHEDLMKLAKIPEGALPRGLRAPPGFAGRSDATVVWVADPTASWAGELTRIESVDADTRTIPAVVEVVSPWSPLESGGLPLLAGTYCRVRLQGKIRPRAWVVPERGLREGDRLFVLRAGTLRIVPVRVDHLLPGEVVVDPLLPLESGDRLVLSPLPFPVEGMGLRVEGTE